MSDTGYRPTEPDLFCADAFDRKERVLQSSVHFEQVDDDARLATVARELARAPRIAFDLEANGFYTYPEQVCLIQIAVPGEVYIIDPLAIDDMAPLGAVLADEGVEKVLHSADYDVRSLDRDWGMRVRNLFDTSIAAAFVGMPRLGLGVVLQDVLAVDLPKSKRLQRADWGLRPLGGEALDYAAGDVRHLLRLREKLGARLLEAGRAEWVAEECSRLSEVRYTAPETEIAFLSVKGSGALDGGGLAVLKSVHAFREREALRLRRPHFKIISDAILVKLAETPGAGLAGIKGLGPYSRSPASNGLRDAVRAGVAAPPVQRPPRKRRSGPSMTRAARARAQERLPKLKAWRAELGVRLGLDPALLWPAASLQRLSMDMEGLEAELDAPEVRRWQRREFGEALQSFLRLTTSPSPPES